jgi:putative transposase
MPGNMKVAYKFRLYPNKLQETVLDATVETCRHLYNNALAARKKVWEEEQRSLTYNQQAVELTATKNHHQKAVFSQVLQDVLRRLDKSFKAFFRRVKAGEEPGYPRFKGEGWYKSFTYPQVGFKLEGSRLTLSKIGSIGSSSIARLKAKSRPVPSRKIKSVVGMRSW